MRQYHSRGKQGGWWQYLIPIATSLISGILGKNSAEAANEQNRENAQKQMDFQREMSGTSYQRGVADMRAAGLNPMLAYSQGGASTPSGAMSTSTPTAMGAAAGVSSAAQAMNSVSQVAQIGQTQAQTDQAEAQTKYIQSQTLDQQLNSARQFAEVQKLLKETDWINTKDKVEYERILGTRYDAMLKSLQYDAERYPPSEQSDVMSGTGFAADVRRRRNLATLSGLDINEAKARSEFYGTDIGKAGPVMDMLMKIFKGFASTGALRR